MALEEDLVAEAAVGLAAEEVVEADLVERGRAGVGREVAADALGPRVGPGHHGGRVPADVGADAALLVLVAGEPGLGVGRDGVHVGRRDGGGEVDLLGARPLEELHEQVARPGPAAGVDDGVERVEPLLRLARIGVGNLVADPVEQHCSTVPGRQGTSMTTGRGCYTFVPCHLTTGPIVVYTDGACRGNPGRAAGPGPCPAGATPAAPRPHTTNQRMEITAALEALRALTPEAPSAIEVVSDSTYVVKCFTRRWWRGLASGATGRTRRASRWPTATCGSRSSSSRSRPTSRSASAGSRATRATAGTTGSTSWRPMAADTGHGSSGAAERGRAGGLDGGRSER